MVAIGRIDRKRRIRIGDPIHPTGGLGGPRSPAVVGAHETRSRIGVVPAGGKRLADVEYAAVASIYLRPQQAAGKRLCSVVLAAAPGDGDARSEEHTSELQS